MSRIYVCHTYYNVYISILKEIHFQRFDSSKGTLALSLMSTDFKDLKKRLEKSFLFDEVVELNEIHPWYFEEKFKFEKSQSNWFFKVIADNFFRWKYTAIQEEKYLNIDFSHYRDIYVYCDSDPIGQFLNYKKIPYHAVEDGLDSCKFNVVKGNSRLFYIRLILAKLGLVFIKDGYSKYAKSLEVNNKSDMHHFGRKLNEVPRGKLYQQLSLEEKQLIYDIFFLENSAARFENEKRNLLIMTQPLLLQEKRIKMYKEIIENHGKGFNIYIKPHPIDDADYTKEFPNCIVLERFFPIEIFNFKCNLNIDKIITVYTHLDDLTFAKEKIRLGIDLLDKYEDPSLHNYLIVAEDKIKTKDSQLH